MSNWQAELQTSVAAAKRSLADDKFLLYIELFTNLKSLETVRTFLKSEFFAPIFRKYYLSSPCSTGDPWLKVFNLAVSGGRWEYCSNPNAENGHGKDQATPWNTCEWKGFFLAKFFEMNKNCPGGCFYECEEPNQRLVICAIALFTGARIRARLQRTALVWDPGYLHSPDLRSFEGLTLVWGNKHHSCCGYPEPGDYSESSVLHMANGPEKESLASIRNVARRYFRVESRSLYIISILILRVPPNGDEVCQVDLSEFFFHILENGKIVDGPDEQWNRSGSERYYIVFHTASREAATVDDQRRGCGLEIEQPFLYADVENRYTPDDKTKVNMRQALQRYLSSFTNNEGSNASAVNASDFDATGPSNPASNTPTRPDCTFPHNFSTAGPQEYMDEFSSFPLNADQQTLDQPPAMDSSPDRDLLDILGLHDDADQASSNTPEIGSSPEQKLLDLLSIHNNAYQASNSTPATSSSPDRELLDILGLHDDTDQASSNTLAIGSSSEKELLDLLGLHNNPVQASSGTSAAVSPQSPEMAHMDYGLYIALQAPNEPPVTPNTPGPSRSVIGYDEGIKRADLTEFETAIMELNEET